MNNAKLVDTRVAYGYKIERFVATVSVDGIETTVHFVKMTSEYSGEVYSLRTFVTEKSAIKAQYYHVTYKN